MPNPKVCRGLRDNLSLNDLCINNLSIIQLWDLFRLLRAWDRQTDADIPTMLMLDLGIVKTASLEQQFDGIWPSSFSSSNQSLCHLWKSENHKTVSSLTHELRKFNVVFSHLPESLASLLVSSLVVRMKSLRNGIGILTLKHEVGYNLFESPLLILISL